MIKVSDYIAKFIANLGVSHVFTVSGAGDLHILDSINRLPSLKFICNHHEQASAMGAFAYSRATKNIGVCLVTTGPGATNAITGMIDCWVDSVPGLYLSGQVQRKYMINDLGIRQNGIQEINIIDMVKPVTKYAAVINDALEIRYFLEKAVYLAKSGRPGPSWLDIPMDIQSAFAIDTVELLANRMQRASEQELAADVVDALLNNETSFFRDTLAFAQLADDILPALARRKADRKRLRIWSAACSTGQEAYSIAILMAEQPELWAGWTIEILGTDISRAAIQRARAGLFSQFEAQRGLPIRRLLAWFDPVLDQGWRVKPEIAAKITFARHNLVGPPPAGDPFDLILCRNALLYFAPERRRQLLEGLSSAIDRQGVLVLGAGETATGVSDRFVIDPTLQSVYRPSGYRPDGEVHAAA